MYRFWWETIHIRILRLMNWVSLDVKVRIVICLVALSMPLMLRCFFQKAGASIRLSYNHASSFIDEVGEDKELDRYYDAVNYLDVNASYTFR